jgi:hypothetical protein
VALNIIASAKHSSNDYNIFLLLIAVSALSPIFELSLLNKVDSVVSNRAFELLISISFLSFNFFNLEYKLRV